jgi:hypothetical protein
MGGGSYVPSVATTTEPLTREEAKTMSAFTFKVVDKPNPFQQLVQAIETLKPSQRVEITVPGPKAIVAMRVRLLQQSKLTEISTTKLSDTVLAIQKSNGARRGSVRSANKKKEK